MRTEHKFMVWNCVTFKGEVRVSRTGLIAISFMVYSTRRFVMSCLVIFCSCVFSPFSTAIISLGGRES